MDNTLFRLRAYNPRDRGYIAKSIYLSWVHCSKNCNRSVDTLNQKIDWLLDKALIKVICLVEDPNNIVGFVVCQPAGTSMLIHCLFIRAAFRRMGLATELLQAIAVSHKKAVQTMNFCDEEFVTKKASEIFDSCLDYSAQWSDDRKET